MQVRLCRAKTSRAARRTVRRAALRLSPPAAAVARLPGVAGSGFAIEKPDLIFPENNVSA